MYGLFVFNFQSIFLCTDSFRSICGIGRSGGLVDKVGFPSMGGCEFESRLKQFLIFFTKL